MAFNNKEIEIQMRVENVSALMDFLQAKAEFKAEKKEVDEYYTPAHRDFLAIRPVKEWLRLRDRDGKFTINYKDWHYEANGQSNYCDEYETVVENIETMRSILAALNCKVIVRVEKVRKTWIYGDYEIDIDSVVGLGDFVEIEYAGTDFEVDPKAVTDQMVEFLRDRNCGKIERNYQGYPFLLLFPGEQKFTTE